MEFGEGLQGRIGLWGECRWCGGGVDVDHLRILFDYLGWGEDGAGDQFGG